MSSRRLGRQPAFSRLSLRLVFGLFIHGLAAIAIIAIIWLFLLIWPIPLLGYTYDLPTASIVSVEPGSPAEEAGIVTGDRIVALYGYPWQVVQRHVNTFLLLGPLDQPVPIVVERNRSLIPFAIPIGPPTAEVQAIKLIHLGLALLCWLTGYLLGVVRRGQAGSPRTVALFWLAMSLLVIGYLFAILASLPLRLVLQWLMLTVLVPLAMLVHAEFPARVVEPARSSRARRWFGAGALMLNLGLLATVLSSRPTLGELVLALSNLLPFALLAALLSSGALLLHDYRRAVSEHLRRQIRLIAMACLIVAAGWLLFLVVPLMLGDDARYTDQASNGITALIPLAYLVGGISPDLYRIDRIVRRIAGHLITASMLLALIAGLTQAMTLRGEVLLLAMTIAGVAAYRPGYRLVLRLLGEPARGSNYRPLSTAMSRFTTTLDANELVQACLTGVRETFAEPALALYLGDIEGTNELGLITQQRLPYVPSSVSSGLVTEVLVRLRAVSDGSAIEAALPSRPLAVAEAQLLHQPGIVLWCPICHTNGSLLAVLLLGLRGDQDPYRPQDVQELQRLCDAAALAFAHSVAYQQRSEAEALARELFAELETAQDEAAARLASRLHDEVINGRLRLNIQSLRQMISGLPETPVRKELELIADSEESVVEALRMICEDLQPTAIDDPLGLAANLRIKSERALLLWPGTCTLEERNDPALVPPEVQREATRIVGEALTNAVKHAQADTISIVITYPAGRDGLLEVEVRDNGVGCQQLRPMLGHRGLRDMRERARTLGGSLELQSQPGVGTVITLRCPIQSDTGAYERIVGA